VRVGEIALLDEVACRATYGCNAKARTAGLETVTVPAGKFEAIKVIVDHSWYPTSAAVVQTGAQMWGERTLTVWYAPQLKRAIKFESVPKFGQLPPIDPEFTLELVSYQLN
jgi:hypothetical protein